MVTNALTEARASEIIEEIREFQSEDCKWQRDILYQALAQWNCEKALDHDPDFLWRKASIKYAEWMSRKDIKTKLYYARQLLTAYHQEGVNLDWGRILEKTLREERNKEISFRYLDYGVQEIIGLYALSRYIYIERPEAFSLKFSDVPMVERIALYGEYFEECTQETLAELNAIDDPTRTHLPNEDEASKIAKQRIEAMIGRKPEGLTKEQQKTYATYEKHACMSQGIVPEHTTKEQKANRIPKATYKTSQTYSQRYIDADFKKLIIVENSEKILEKLHKLIDHRKGKDIGVVLAAATYKYHVLSRTPKEAEFRSEFTNIEECSWRSISAWLKKVNKYEDLPQDVRDFVLDFQ